MVLLVLAIANIVLLFKQKNDKLFYYSAIILGLLYVFRFGQGSDYLSYNWWYYNLPTNFNDMLTVSTHLDFGFRMLYLPFLSLNLDFYVFTICLSMLLFSLYFYTINKYSSFKLFSLVYLFLVYYLVYMESALRQGIVMSIYLFLYYKYKDDRNLLFYTIGTLACCLIHKVSILLFIIPFLFYIIKKFRFSYIIAATIAFTILLLIVNPLQLLYSIGANVPYYSGVSDISILSIIYRTIFLILALMLYLTIDTEQIDSSINTDIYIYIFSYCLYIVLSRSSMMSRITDIFYIIDLILFANLLSKLNSKKLKYLFIGIIMVMNLTLFVKDIYANIQQGSYYSTNILDYPYISIFNKKDIFDYRNMPEHYKIYLEKNLD